MRGAESRQFRSEGSMALAADRRMFPSGSPTTRTPSPRFPASEGAGCAPPFPPNARSLRAMATSDASTFDSVLRRMFERDGVDSLPAHLESACGIVVAKISELDVGVFRVDRGDSGAPLVARLFSSARSYEAAQADLAVLRYLAEIDFPAERPVQDGPLTSHEGQALLLTEFVKEAPKAKQPPHPI